MALRKDYSRPLDLKHGRVDMNHGAGGRASAQLIEALFARAFDNPALREGNDGAVLPAPPAVHRLVLATDAHVISPLFFPGGDIGALSVHGTVNDVAMMGAQPLSLSASFILEEGLPLADLKRHRRLDGRGRARGPRSRRSCPSPVTRCWAPRRSCTRNTAVRTIRPNGCSG